MPASERGETNREPYPVPAREVRVTSRVANSRFISTIGPAFDVESARAFVARVRHTFSDATHNVSAYLIGHGGTVIAHCHDDGEPSGTAGRPALAVLRGSGLGDVVVVVTRYFGGTKLGTGGLVRAYGDSVRQALDALPRAIRVSTVTVSIDTPYNLFERLRLLIAAHRGAILDETFAVQVEVTARLAKDRLLAFEQALQEMSRGQLQAQVMGEDETTILPLDPAKDGSHQPAPIE